MAPVDAGGGVGVAFVDFHGADCELDADAGVDAGHDEKHA